MRAAEPLRPICLLVFAVLAGCGTPESGGQAATATSVPSSGEQCLTCHADERGFSPFHPVGSIGCASCHLGNTEATTDTEAHQGMEVIPGNLSNAAATCGAAGCHPQWVSRVEGSLMATGRGIVSVDRWAFGEAESPNGKDGLGDLGDSPADSHLRALCMNCHLGTEKTQAGPLEELSRGGGCLACHLSYDVADAGAHPRLTVDVPNARCEGCHSRSGRISLHFGGWSETTLAAHEAGRDMRVLADGRVLTPQPEDVHHGAGMACIDCHTAYETMGDGEFYFHQEEATEVTCVTCHEPSGAVSWADLDPDQKRLVALRTGAPPSGREYGVSEISGRAVTNLFRDLDSEWALQSKLDGVLRPLAAPTAACQLDGHERVSCQSCHSAWVPQCLGCHTQQLDDGSWVELIDEFRAEPPVLGVRTFRSADGVIEPFAPGMIMTLDIEPMPAHGDPATWAGRGTFHRLYAPAVPHTTVASGRSCESCHLSSLAMGFGRGALVLGEDGNWQFTPRYAALQDELPADAWMAFPGSEGRSTRLDARPLGVQELERVMRVGACLTCHPAEQDAWLYEDFARALGEVSEACVVPGG